MKIRNGFVSNSSSSSFIIISKDVDVQQLTLADLDTKDIYVLGRYLGDGIDLFKIEDERILTILKDKDKVEELSNKYGDDIRVIEVLDMSTDRDLSINTENFPKEFNIISEDVDYHTTTDFEGFCYNYEIDESYKTLINRKYKLEILKKYE